jgi:hypothetical protein
MPSNIDNERKNIGTGFLTVSIRMGDGKVLIFPGESIKECFFIEDIFSYCMVGKLSFVDNVGLYEYGPLTGNETVAIRYGRYSEKEIIFHITSVISISPTEATGSDATPIISLELIDTSYEFMTLNLFSRSFDAKLKHTDVIKHLLMNMVGWSANKINILESSSEFEEPFVIPYWTIIDTMIYILNKAKYSANDYGYLCYNNTKNGFSVNVLPLSYLLSESNVVDKIHYNLDDTKEQINNKIFDWWFEGIEHQDTKNYRRSIYLTHDIETKSMTKIDIKYDDFIKFNKILGKYTLFDNTYGLEDKLTTSYDIVNAVNMDEVYNKLHNDFTKRYNVQQVLNVIVYGNEKRYAGHQIIIDWPSIDKTSKSLSKIYEGVYLVKTITHDFVGNNKGMGYTQRMVLIKNGYQNPSTKFLKKAVISNISGGKKTTEFSNE